MSQYLIDQIALVTSIGIETETYMLSADGTDCPKAIKTRKAGEPVIQRSSDALFVTIGADAVTDWLPRCSNECGYIRTGREVSETSDRGTGVLHTC